MIYLNYHQYYNTGSIHYKFCSPCMHLTNILDYMIVFGSVCCNYCIYETNKSNTYYLDIVMSAFTLKLTREWVYICDLCLSPRSWRETVLIINL